MRDVYFVSLNNSFRHARVIITCEASSSHMSYAFFQPLAAVNQLL